MSNRVKNKLTQIPYYKIPKGFDLEKCLGVPLGSNTIRTVENPIIRKIVEVDGEERKVIMATPEEEKVIKAYSVFGACLQAMKQGKTYLKASMEAPPFYGLFRKNSPMENLRWEIGPTRVAKIEKQETGASPETLNKLRLDAIKLLLDDKYIELDSEGDRAKAMELGLIEIPTFEED